VRWIGGHAVGGGSRMRIRFYDLNELLVVDLVTSPASTTGVALRTITFGETPMIPACGYVTFGPAVDFSPNNLTVWGVLSGGPNVGVNNAAQVVIRRTIAQGSVDGELEFKAPGDVGISNGVLAFELVGNKQTGPPTGACCTPETGICAPALKWECEDVGGLFQGEGTSCSVCADDPFQGCNTTQDCIDAGDVGPCIPPPPSCLRSACCDPDTGECGLSSSGGTCDESLGPCNNDLQCTGGTDTCEPNCPGRCQAGNLNAGEFCNVHADCDATSEGDGLGTCEPVVGLVSQGFGTTCEPNCCTSPTLGNKDLEGPFPNTGTPGDTCIEAELNKLVIDVAGMDIGEVATYTITTNNKNATFGDNQNGCTAGIFDPNGNTRDRGWWFSFSINACADIRVDNCCTETRTGEAQRPQWANLYGACNPCGGLISNSITGALTTPPIGKADDASARGEPFCPGDDLWQTFRSVQAGTWWMPLYTATGGHFGEIQTHIVLTPCPVAACCLPDGSCELLNKSDCDAADGYFNGFGNIPVDQDPVVTCATPYLCVAGECASGPNEGDICVNDSDCGPASVCGFGSCCGPNGAAGVCKDGFPSNGDCDPSNPSSCMDRATCLTNLNGLSYQGGARCGYPENPCPACQIEGNTNCQGTELFIWANGGNLQESDLDEPPHGAVTVDDFIPSASSIKTVCVWGSYQDPSRIGNACFSCSGAVADKFRVRIYADLENVAGASSQPGVLIGERDVSGAAVAKSFVAGTALQTGYTCPPNKVEVFSYTLDLGTPISLPDVNNKVYWLEVANDTTHLTGSNVNEPAEATENTCSWYWTTAFRQVADGSGNNYSHTGTNDRPVDQGGSPCTAGNVCCEGGDIPDPGDLERRCGYQGDGRSGRAVDFVFCLGNETGGGVPFDPPPEPLGACCACGGVCQIDKTLAACNDGMLDADNNIDGVWMASNDCNDCVAQEGDNCGGAAGAVAAGLDCQPDVVGGPELISDGLFAYNSTCSTTDGPNEGKLTDTDYLVEETWYKYQATCTGKLVISSCASGQFYGGFDSFMAVYSNENATCPPCPTTTSALVAIEDESCSGLQMGGAGTTADRLGIVTPGDCYLISAGGWDDSATGSIFSHGGAMIDVQCIPSLCTPSNPPLQGKIVGGGAGGQNKRMVRHLAVRADIGDAGKSQAIRVKVTNLPAPFTSFNGAKLFVQAPVRICENAGQKTLPNPLAPPNFGCLGSGNFPRTTVIATLGPDPYYQDWHGVCTGSPLKCVGGLKDGLACTTTASCAADVNIHHTLLVPSVGATPNATYEVQMVADDCIFTAEDSYSDPLVTSTCRRGNTVSNCSTQPCGQCDNIATQIDDVTAILSKFGNLGGIDKVRADMEGCCPDHLIQIGDVTSALDGFTAKPYPCSPVSAGCPN